MCLRPLLQVFSHKAYCFVLGLILTTLGSTTNLYGQLEPATWTDSSGKFRIEATFVRMDRDNVVLRNDQGKETAVPLTRLSSESQKQAWDQAAKLKASAPPRSSGTARGAAAGNRPASNAVVEQSATPLAVPENASAQAFADFVFEQLKQGQFIVMWDALPPSYQTDVEEVAKLAVTKVEPWMIKEFTKVRDDLVSVLRTKKDFIMNTPVLEGTFADPNAKIAYDPAVELLAATLGENSFDATGIQSTGLRPIMAKYLSIVAARSQSLQEVLPKDGSSPVNVTDLENVEYRIEAAISNSAVLVTQSPDGEETRTELVVVEGRWVPKELANDWKFNIDEAKRMLNNTTPQQMAQAKQNLMLPLTMVNGTLGGFKSARSQAEFDDAFNNLFGLFGGLLPMNGGFPGAGGAPPGFPQGQPGFPPGLPGGFDFGGDDFDTDQIPAGAFPGGF